MRHKNTMKKCQLMRLCSIRHRCAMSDQVEMQGDTLHLIRPHQPATGVVRELLRHLYKVYDARQQPLQLKCSAPVQAAQADAGRAADDGRHACACCALHPRLQGVQRVHHEGGATTGKSACQRRLYEQLLCPSLLYRGPCTDIIRHTALSSRCKVDQSPTQCLRCAHSTDGDCLC